jgi:hypothetical protein
MKFVVDKVAMKQRFLGVLQFSLVSIFPPMPRTHLLIYHLSCIILSIDSIVKKLKNEMNTFLFPRTRHCNHPLYVSILFSVPLLPFLSHLPLPKVAFYSRRVILWEALQRGLASDGLWKLNGIRTRSGRLDRSVQSGLLEVTAILF